MNEDRILSHFKNQKHFSLSSHLPFHPVANTSCGDEVNLYLELEDGKVEKALFSGTACTVTLASAEYLCASIEGKSLEEISPKRLQEEGLNYFEMKETDKRAPCALLPYRALAELKQKLVGI